MSNLDRQSQQLSWVKAKPLLEKILSINSGVDFDAMNGTHISYTETGLMVRRILDLFESPPIESEREAISRE